MGPFSQSTYPIGLKHFADQSRSAECLPRCMRLQAAYPHPFPDSAKLLAENGRMYQSMPLLDILNSAVWHWQLDRRVPLQIDQ